MFFRALADFAGNTALVSDSGERLSYVELATRADEFCNKITQARSLVFLFCDNSIQCVAAYIGLLRGNHVPLLLDSSMDNGLADKLISKYQPNYVVSPATQFKPRSNASVAPVQLHESLGLLLMTSGTTGSPKLVRLTRENLQANAESIAKYLQLSEGEIPVTSLPIHYSFGLSVLNSHLLVGATVAVTNLSYMQKPFWEFLSREKCTSISGVPYTFTILRKLGLNLDKYPSIRYLAQAGGRLAPELISYFAKHCSERGKLFFTMYGQTEATARMAWLNPQDCSNHPNSIGRAIPGGEIYIEDSVGHRINEPLKEGELVYRGPNVMLGYAETKSDLAKGDELRQTLRTGDLGHFDAEGLFYVTGRLKRIVKLHGNRISLDDLESELRCEGIEAICMGTDDKLHVGCLNESHHAVIKDLLQQRFHFHPTVFAVHVIKKIITNVAGKIQYRDSFYSSGVEI